MKYTVASALIAIFVALPAYALELQAARANGSVCEKSDGYVDKVSGGNDVSALVSTVNTARKAEYAKISKENGQTVDVVAKIAAGKISAGPKCK